MAYHIKLKALWPFTVAVAGWSSLALVFSGSLSQQVAAGHDTTDIGPTNRAPDTSLLDQQRVLVVTIPIACSHTMLLLKVSEALLQRSVHVTFLASQLDESCINQSIDQSMYPNLKVRY